MATRPLLLAASALLLLSAAAAPAAAAAAAKPHIVFVLADDYGWANLGVHRRGEEGGSEQARGEAQTPNLDALIDEGVLLDRHYAYKICSPSRSSLQSGRLAVHVNAVNTGVTVANATDPVSGAAGIPRKMTGLAQKLREGGYRTHMVGKWDAGMASPEHTPLGRGYETWIGYFQHANDYWRKGMPWQSTGELDNCLNKFTDFFMHNASYRGGVRDVPSVSPRCLENPQSSEECYEEAAFKERALAVVREHDTANGSAPLFLFYSFHLLHTPLQVPERYLERIDDLALKSSGSKFDSMDRRLYAAMTLYMDEAVGELVAALRARGMWDNTLFIFTADNGGPIYTPGSANNHPLKGGKYTDWEGGVRVNAFLSGGFVPTQKRGSVFSGVVSIADWYGTLCELAGVDAADVAAERANAWLEPRGLPLLPPVDSVAQWGFIMNGTNGRPSLQLSEHGLLQWPYKLVTGKQSYSRWTGDIYPNCTTIAQVTDGPLFQDFKVFDVSIPGGATKEETERLEWVQDCGAGCLFNVEEDPTEHTDLAQDPSYASTLARMTVKLQDLNHGVFAPGRGTPSFAACKTSIDNGGFYGPFVDAEGWYSPGPAKTMKERVKDAELKGELALVNTEIVQLGIEAAARRLLPLVKDRLAKTVDRCLKEEAIVV